MNWLRRFSEPDLFNVLLWLPPHTRPTHVQIVAGLTIVAMAIYAISKRIRRAIRPRIIGFELARSVSTALNILDRWDVPEKRRACAVVVIDFLFMPVLTALIAYLCFWGALSVRYEVPWLAGAGVLMGWAALVALPAAWIEDLAMLKSMLRNPASKSVFLTRLFGTLKYGILAIATAFLVCRFEYFVYQLIEPVVRRYPRSTLAALAACSAGFGMWMLQLANPLHPSLLMLHLAQSREAANRVLNRWGKKGQDKALWANRVDMVFAILSTQTLAFLFFRLSGRHEYGPVFVALSQSVGWYMLLAGTCHVAQNCGAEAALRETKMGWWIHICRACGGLRVLLLFLGGVWGGILWLRWEGSAGAKLLSFLQATAGAGR